MWVKIGHTSLSVGLSRRHNRSPIHFERKLNEPMHIGMRLLHPAAADHSVSISRQQVQARDGYRNPVFNRSRG